MGGMTGIPSNVGVIKAFYQKNRLSLDKGTAEIPLNLPFSMDRIIGAIVVYGGYIGSQAMMAENGNYDAGYGLSVKINYDTKKLLISSSGSYSERDLNIIIFYI